ncbi:50S ribosomal protein L10 [Candidatus Peregrinibacteria bacterium]|jgi:large subunit ribosomal protein L10|nr:50S ribosomal protein L10 [Candidatus Peregrinibacteria bacterium]
MPITKEKKAEILAALIEEFKSAKSIAVAKTNGMTVMESQDFRRKLRENDVQFKIAKKTLICLAAKEAGYDVDPAALEGSIGLAFSPDEVTGAKLVKQQDKKKKKMELVALFLEGQFLGKEGADELADIPGKEELLAKFVGMLQSPLNSFAGMLGSPLSGFARALSEYAKSKPAEEAPVEETEEPAEETPKAEASESEDSPKEDAEASKEEKPE